MSFFSFLKKTYNHRGISLVEIILATSVFALFITAYTGAIIVGQRSSITAGNRARAVFLADEAIEAVRSIGSEAWNEIVFSQTAIEYTTDQWEFTVEGDNDEIDGFTREIVFSDVCRNISGDIVACPGDYTDLHTKKATVTVSWSELGVSRSVGKDTYLTNWNSEEWTQTNWEGGDGQNIWSDNTKYQTDDGNVDTSTSGEIKLKSTSSGTCSPYTWEFDSGANYDYDSGKIEVVSSKAQLVGESSNTSGNTEDPGFSSGTPWSSYGWDIGGGESYYSGILGYWGNPSYWAYSYIITRKNREAGGIWEQSFDVSVNNPDSVNVDLDYMIWSQNIGSYGKKTFNLYIENSSGEPSTSPIWTYEVDDSEPYRNWYSVNGIDATSAISSSGTYYLKLGIWVETDNVSGNPNFTFIGGWDNVSLSWEKNISSYPTDRPTIRPNNSYEPAFIDFWTGFTEVAAKDGGEVYYQLSDDEGSSWKYWDGSSWSNASSSDYNTATEVNENIVDFDTGTESIMFKAFLESNGDQFVQLDSVTVECSMFKAQAGIASADNNWTNVTFSESMSKPIVVASFNEQNNFYPASVRIRNISRNGFEVKIHNPLNRSLNTEEITYFTIDEGVWEIGGIKVEAHKYETDTVGAASGGWDYDSKSYDHTYSSDPVVFHQVMTDNDSDWITTWVSRGSSRTNPPNTSGFGIGLNGAEHTSSHGEETIGWIAIQRDISASLDGVDFETSRTNDSVRGHDNGCFNYSYLNSYSSVPLAIVSQQEMDGPNGGWAVVCDNSPSEVSMYIDEDRSRDSERSHTTEIAAFLAFSESFVYTPSSASGYETFGSLQSSAYNMIDQSSVQIVSWDEDTSGCNPDCEIKVQLRTASDSGGTPGSWSDWYGETGSGSFFTVSEGGLVSKDLNGNEWVQYRVELSGNGSQTPIFEEIIINYN